jgi:peptidoglycan hydrolase-like protein with peptidoglycan-binding domain
VKVTGLRFRVRRFGLPGVAGRTVGVLVGALAFAALLAVPANAAIGTLGPGSSGTQVKVWQQDLNSFISQLNTCHPTLTVDGQYGAATTNATSCFQSLEKLSVDGVEGPQTRAQMCLFMGDRGAIGTPLYQQTCQ